MYACHLHELLCDVIIGHEAAAFAETEQVLLVFEHFGDLLVELDVLVAHRGIDALRQRLNIHDEGLSSRLDFFVENGRLLV